MESYLQDQDLWKIIGGSDSTPPSAEDADALEMWWIKAEKALFAIKITIQKEMLEHIQQPPH